MKELNELQNIRLWELLEYNNESYKVRELRQYKSYKNYEIPGYEIYENTTVLRATGTESYENTWIIMRTTTILESWEQQEYKRYESYENTELWEPREYMKSCEVALS